MILKINTRGISIDVSDSEVFIEKFGTPLATVPEHTIRIFKVIGGLIYIETHESEEFTIHPSVVTSLNGDATVNTLTVPELWHKINLALYEI